MEHVISASCKELIAQLSGFLDGELDTSVCEAIEQHLAACPDCRVVVDTIQKTILLYRDAPQEIVPHQVHKHLIKALGLDNHITGGPA